MQKFIGAVLTRNSRVALLGTRVSEGKKLVAVTQESFIERPYSEKKKLDNQLIIQKLAISTSPQARNKLVKKTRVSRENTELIHEMDNLLVNDDKPILSQTDMMKKDLVEFVSSPNIKTGSEIIESTKPGQSYFTQEEMTKIHATYKDSVFFKNTKTKLEKYFLNYNVLVHRSKDQNDLYYVGHQLLKYMLIKYFNQHLNLVVESESADKSKMLNIINDNITKSNQINEHLIDYFLNNRQLFYLYIHQNNLRDLEPFIKDISFTSSDFLDKSAHERIFKSLIGNIYMNVDSFDIVMNQILYPYIVNEFIPRFTNLVEDNLSQLSTKKAFEKQMNIVEQFEYFHTRQYKSPPTYSSMTTEGDFGAPQMVQLYSSTRQLLSVGYGKDYQTAKEDAARRALLHFC